jgi:hypothetical protein
MMLSRRFDLQDSKSLIDSRPERLLERAGWGEKYLVIEGFVEQARLRSSPLGKRNVFR